MKINRLTLHNFGIYAHKNTLDLSSEKPVILIGGMNGRGKTTILEAVLLALYGRRSFAFEESNRSFPKYLASLINKTDNTNSTSVELKFELPAENGSDQYSVRREWSLRTSAPTLKTSVIKNGDYDQILSDNWDMFVEEILPNAIAPFFFFDGEKISELAISDDDQSMKESIKALLGINVIDQAITDIQRVLNSKKKAVKADKFAKEIKEFDEKLARAEELVIVSTESAGLLEVKQRRLEIKLREAENAFSTQGGGLVASRKDLVAQMSELDEKLEKVNSRILDVASGDLPLLMTMPLISGILEVAEGEREQRGIRAALEQLPALFKQYSKSGSRVKNFNDFLSFVKSTSMDTDPVYDLTESGFLQLKMLHASLPGIQREEARRLLTERKELLSQKEEIENYLSLNVNENEAGKHYKEILRLTSELATVTEQHRLAKAITSTNKAQCDELKRQQLKVVERAVGNLEGADDTKRIVTYAGYSAEVLQEYKKRLQAAKTKQLAHTMTECWGRIAFKQNLIHEIRIDELSLDFHYFNNDGTEINRASFSAGEKQLLVIAMLWALGICSKKQFPIIIDTPLARLDSVHREALIKNYFPCASEQTILLSTDAEVHGKYYDLLRPFVEKEYTLVYDDSTKQSSVRNGYFGGEPQ